MSSSGASEGSPFELRKPTGHLSDAISGYFQRIQGTSTYQERVDADLQADLSKATSESTTYAGRVLPWAWWRMPEAVGGAPAPQKTYFELKEGWIERTSNDFDIRVGNQIVSWGAADQINPTDVWNPRDYYDLLQSTKLPLFMGRVKIHPQALENVSLEALYSPFFRQTRLPVTVTSGATTQFNLTDSRWLLALPSTLNANNQLVAPLQYTIAPSTFPVTWQAGGRLMIQRVAGWDFSASYYNGVENTPRIAFSTQGNPNNPALPITLLLYPSYHRQQMFGFDGSGSVSIAKHDFGTRFELAYYKRDNSRALTAPPQFVAALVKDDYVNGVAGFDYTVPTSVLGTTVYFNAQYVFYRRLGNNEQAAGNGIVSGLPDVIPWDSNGVLYLEDRIGSTLKITSNTVYSFQHGDCYESPGLQYSWSDNFKTTVSADFFLGNTGGFFGQFYDMKRANLLASYSF